MKKSEHKSPRPTRLNPRDKAGPGGAFGVKPDHVYNSLVALRRALPGKLITTERSGSLRLFLCDGPGGLVQYAAKRVLSDAEQTKLEGWSDERLALAQEIRQLGDDASEQARKRYDDLGKRMDALWFAEGRYELLLVHQERTHVMIEMPEGGQESAYRDPEEWYGLRIPPLPQAAAGVEKQWSRPLRKSQIADCLDVSDYILKKAATAGVYEMRPVNGSRETYQICMNGLPDMAKQKLKNA